MLYCFVKQWNSKMFFTLNKPFGVNLKPSLCAERSREMKILVIDDNPIHLQAAKQALKGHELTVCDDADEALELLGPRYDEVIYGRVLAEHGFLKGCLYIPRGSTTQDFEGYEKAHAAAREGASLPYWDVVLSDLLMPAPRHTQGDRGMRFVGEEMPIGWAFVLEAAMRGAKYAAVATDTDHHDHPASALLDNIGGRTEFPPRFIVNGARVGFYNYALPMCPVEGSVCPWCTGSGKRDASDEPCVKCDGDGKARGKDWGEILAALAFTA